MRKVALIGGGAVAVLLAVAVGLGLFLYSSLDSLVKKAIETVGSEVAGVPVTVSGVTIALTEGKATIKGLQVANPKGFNSPSAFRLDEIAIAIDTGSVTGNPVVIKDISVVAPEVTVEAGAQGSNLDVLQRNLAGKGAAQGSGGGGEAKKLVIDRLSLTKGSVTLATPIPGAKATGNLGDIVLTGIGRNSSGATGAQVAQKVLDALVKSSVKAVQGMGVGGLVEGVAGAPGALVPGAAGETLKGVFGK